MEARFAATPDSTGLIAPHLRVAGDFGSSVAGSSALFLTIKPIEGARSPQVDVRLFQSRQALVLIALNHRDEAVDATIVLPSGMPLAEWVTKTPGPILSNNSATAPVMAAVSVGPVLGVCWR
jgi:hypothetical protein